MFNVLRLFPTDGVGKKNKFKTEMSAMFDKKQVDRVTKRKIRQKR